MAILNATCHGVFLGITTFTSNRTWLVMLYFGNLFLKGTHHDISKANYNADLFLKVRSPGLCFWCGFFFLLLFHCLINT